MGAVERGRKLANPTETLGSRSMPAQWINDFCIGFILTKGKN